MLCCALIFCLLSVTMKSAVGLLLTIRSYSMEHLCNKEFNIDEYNLSIRIVADALYFRSDLDVCRVKITSRWWENFHLIIFLYTTANCSSTYLNLVNSNFSVIGSLQPSCKSNSVRLRYDFFISTNFYIYLNKINHRESFRYEIFILPALTNIDVNVVLIILGGILALIISITSCIFVFCSIYHNRTIYDVESSANSSVSLVADINRNSVEAERRQQAITTTIPGEEERPLSTKSQIIFVSDKMAPLFSSCKNFTTQNTLTKSSVCEQCKKELNHMLYIKKHSNPLPGFVSTVQENISTHSLNKKTSPSSHTPMQSQHICGKLSLDTEIEFQPDNLIDNLRHYNISNNLLIPEFKVNKLENDIIQKTNSQVQSLFPDKKPIRSQLREAYSAPL